MMRTRPLLSGVGLVVCLGWVTPAWATDAPSGTAPTEATTPPVMAAPQPTPAPQPMPAAQPMPAPNPAPTHVAPQPQPWPTAAAQPSVPTAAAAKPEAPSASAGLGITGSLTYGFGFAYQRTFAHGHWQINGVPMVWDRGDNAVASAGTALVWYPWLASSRRWLGGANSDTALRIVGGGSVFYNARKTVSTTIDTSFGSDGQPRPAATVTTVERDLWLSVGAGAGFEFGAIHQPGFSVALDLLWTATWAHTSAEGWRLRQLVPLPAGSLVYHW